MDDAAKKRKPRKTERRKAERKRAFTAGLLAYGGGAFVMDCLIRDIGATGAQIRTSPAQPMPNEGFLIDLKTWMAYQAHRIWYSSSLAGFRFEREYSLRGALPPALEFLRGLFVEAQLRQVENLTAQGLDISEALSKLKVANATYLHWLEASARAGARRFRPKAPDGGDDNTGLPYRL